MISGPGFWITFAYYFASTTIIGVLMATQVLGTEFGSALPYQLGLILGLAGGALGGYFNRSQSVSGTVKSQKQFLRELETALTALGYEAQGGDRGLSSLWAIAGAGAVFGQDLCSPRGKRGHPDGAIDQSQAPAKSPAQLLALDSRFPEAAP